MYYTDVEREIMFRAITEKRYQPGPQQAVTAGRLIQRGALSFRSRDRVEPTEHGVAAYLRDISEWADNLAAHRGP